MTSKMSDCIYSGRKLESLQKSGLKTCAGALPLGVAACFAFRLSLDALHMGGVFHYIIKLRKIFLSNRAKENMVPCANTTGHDAIYIRVPASNHHESAFSEVIS